MYEDPIALEVFRNALVGVAEDMGEVMRRAALSPMIKERNDRSCAVFSPDVELVGQAEHLPIHLALLVSIVPAALQALDGDLEPGDVCLHNDPYVGGSHLPDLTAISPVYEGDELLGYVAVIAHHGDVGGITPGGVGGITRDILEEGVIIPPLKLCRKGVLADDVMRILKANVRLPREFEGDLLAQIAALQAGVNGIRELANKVGQGRFRQYSKDLLTYSEQRTRKAIADLPSGVAEFTDYVDDDGMGSGPLQIKLRLTISDHSIEADFTGSHPQLPAPVNASLAVTRSAVFFALRCLIDQTIPTTSGCFRLVNVVAPAETIVNAQPPVPVAGGSLETAQRIVDVLFGALAQLVPDRIPAAGMGSHNTIAIGGYDRSTGERFVVCENLSGGGGARRHLDGVSVRRVNLMNTPNNPVEVLERDHPLLVRRVELREDSGGSGRRRGGLGLRKEYEFLSESSVAILSDRKLHRPWGLDGGSAGAGSSHTLIRADGDVVALPSKVQLNVQPGDRLLAETAGGGGYGDPIERSSDALENDHIDGYSGRPDDEV